MTVPAERIGGYLVVTVRAGRSEDYHFIIDTGASLSLVSPAFAARHARSTRAGAGATHVRAEGSDGRDAVLPAVELRGFSMGSAEFTAVPALVYDFDSLSLQLGERIDGLLGFPVFRDTTLTLDYPHNQVRLDAPRPVNTPSPGAGFTLPFQAPGRAPLVSVEVEGHPVTVLIDSGRTSALTLNPFGLSLSFTQAPRPGALVATLAGEHVQQIGRLAEPVRIGPYEVATPLVELTDSLSALGSEVLANFSLTFDQHRGEVTFSRENFAPIQIASKRSLGLSFQKTGAYWRVAAVVPGSPADSAGVEVGDLCVRIDDQPVSRWTQDTFLGLLASAQQARLTFVEGTREIERIVPVFNLVP